jgi:hypothetical protein
MHKRKSVAIVHKCTFVNMASMVATNVDDKALVGKLALLDNVAVLSEDALLEKIAVLGKLAFLGKVVILGKFTSWRSHRANSPSSAKLPLEYAGVALSSLRMSPWRCCHCRCRGAGIIAALASS